MNKRFSLVGFTANISGLYILGKKVGHQDWQNLGTITNGNSIRMDKSTWHLRAMDQYQEFDILEYKIEDEEHIVNLSTNNNSTSNVIFKSNPPGWNVWGKEMGNQDWKDLNVKTNNHQNCKNTTWYFQVRKGSKRGDMVEKRIIEDTAVDLPITS